MSIVLVENEEECSIFLPNRNYLTKIRLAKMRRNQRYNSAIKASSPLFLGAEVNLNIDGIDLRQALIKTFGPEILNFQPSDLEDAIKVKFPRS